MGQIIRKFNRMLFDNLMFRSNDIESKVVTGFVYISLIFPLLILNFSPIIIRLAILIGQMVVLYLLYLFLYLIIEIPNKVFFSEMNELCNRVESIFKDEFYKYNSFLVDTKMPEIERIVNKNKIPEKDMRLYWKYRLSTKKESIQTIVPIVGLMVFAIFRHPLFNDIFKTVINKFINNKEISYFKASLEMLTYPYLFLVYHSNINRVNFCIDKIEFLEEVL